MANQETQNTKKIRYKRYSASKSSQIKFNVPHFICKEGKHRYIQISMWKNSSGVRENEKVDSIVWFKEGLEG